MQIDILKTMLKKRRVETPPRLLAHLFLTEKCIAVVLWYCVYLARNVMRHDCY